MTVGLDFDSIVRLALTEPRVRQLQTPDRASEREERRGVEESYQERRKTSSIEMVVGVYVYDICVCVDV